MINNMIKKRAIKRYLNELGSDLARRYGKSEHYTPEQVIKTVQDENYNWKHICYAHALFTTMEQFDRIHQEQGENCDYYEMRNEVVESFFGGASSSLDACIFGDISGDGAGFSGGGGGGGGGE